MVIGGPFWVLFFVGFVFLVSDEKIVKYKFTYMILEFFFVFN